MRDQAELKAKILHERKYYDSNIKEMEAEIALELKAKFASFLLTAYIQTELFRIIKV